ncbi:rod shape-determining protein MreC [Thermohalobacter berrensis]|uniref:Cell shape-determining protein MreC n=1 Tax=Thermohalobacter berrensis TaxID=99594 RepID=A0A419T6V0_9FIRM|nr:rod shape-determining protein MreC [Thermohalobacter berrensis]RKD33201.1 rod shape-determining protein MreC [Thermohalobacter berrensis]
MSKFNKYKGRMIVTFVTIILIIIIGLTASGKVKIKFGQDIIGRITMPVQKVFYNIGEFFSNGFHNATNFFNLKEENEKLKAKIAKLERENRILEDVISREEYLEKEAKLKEKTDFNLTEAQIIGKSPENWFDRFLIDKGEKDGIKKGDIIIHAVEFDDEIIEAGLVGRVIEVGDNWSKGLAIIDEGSKVAFKVIRTQDGGIIRGSIQGEITGYLFDMESDVVKGDKLMTSGLGDIFIGDLYIGKVSEVIKEKEELIENIVVEPAVNFKKLNEVFVITGNKE